MRSYSPDDIRADHAALLRSWWKESTGQSSAERVRNFVRDVAAAGAALSGEQDRKAAQEILNYWAVQLKIISPEDADVPPLAAYVHEEGRTMAQAAPDANQTAREQIRLTALARQWIDSGRNPGYLLNGSAIKTASSTMRTCRTVLSG